MVEIGGVTVSKGGTIYWGALLSVLLGAPVYAVELGVIGTLEAWRQGIGDSVRGFTETVVAFISVPLDGVAGAFHTAEATFVRRCRPRRSSRCACRWASRGRSPAPGRGRPRWSWTWACSRSRSRSWWRS